MVTKEYYGGFAYYRCCFGHFHRTEAEAQECNSFCMEEEETIANTTLETMFKKFVEEAGAHPMETLQREPQLHTHKR